MFNKLYEFACMYITTFLSVYAFVVLVFDEKRVNSTSIMNILF